MTAPRSAPSDPVYLMCPPEHFAITAPPGVGAANDMSVQGARVYQRDPAAFRARATRKWEHFRNVLERDLGARTITLDPSPDLPDQVFAADASISLTTAEPDSHVALLSRFTYEERQPEADLHAATLKDFDRARVLARADYNIEGCGDNVYDPIRDLFWSGCANAPTRARAGEGRSDARAHAQLAELTGVDVVSLRVRRPFFHLDTAVAILPRGHVMCCPEGLAPDALDTLKQRAFEPYGLSAQEHFIEVSRADADRYACNVVVRDELVVLPLVSDELLSTLRAKGYAPIATPLEEFILSGGGPHCLTNRLNEQRSPHGLAARQDRPVKVNASADP